MSGRILLHICCAPCAIYPVKFLREAEYNITGYWFNPNIHGYSEYSKRLMTLGYFVNIKKFDIIESDYVPEEWFSGLNGFTKEERCSECYRLRLFSAASAAKENGFTEFTTTLLYSKFQEHLMIKQIAQEAALNNGINFLYIDFREGWKEGIQISKKLGLYRQNYCGCLFSEMGR
ncbi:MAG: epoxyqueuosine reductase QueH [Elusimicrobiota bacterium]